MRFRALLVAVSCCGLVCQGRAQTQANPAPATVDDGIRAFVAGDYARAARMLVPLAESSRPADPVAQFFVGFLYYSSLGVPGDRFRACSLFEQSAAAANPFAAIAARMARGIEETTSRFSCAQLAKPIPLTAAVASGPDVDAPATVNAAGAAAADAIVAFAHADYARAVEILKPMTEKSAMPDQTATFFMGMLYEAGLGIQADAVRACAHYQQAGTPVPGAEQPFSQAAMFVLGPMFPTNPPAMDRCLRMAVHGFDAGFEPLTFQLSQDHSIDWDADGATVWYKGASKRFPWDLQPLGGGRFLPLRYTPLQTGPQRTDRRDFIEYAFWQRGPGARWHLQWFLFEVVRDDVLTIAAEELATLNVEDVPAVESDELRRYVRLEVNDQGDAEWSMVSGDQSAHAIDTDADRELDRVQQARTKARDAARKQALARGRTAELHDSNRPPSFTYITDDVDGCGMIDVAGWSEDHSEAIVVWTTPDVPLPGTFTLDSGATAIHVDVHVYKKPTGNVFCRDYGTFEEGQEDRIWHATSGVVTIDMAPQPAPHRKERSATVTIKDAVFVSPNGQAVRLIRPVVLMAIVGTVVGG